MAICPKCKKVITELSQRMSGTKTARVFINKEGLYDAEEEDFEIDGYYYEYSCVECWEVLFEDDGDAYDFLLNTDELKELVSEKIDKMKKGGDKDEGKDNN